ncbi:MAG TPA: 16S rRNA (cytidine(1402)-2'-O)-methyltransferase [Gaiellales bacterium]|jgi:16S rRNA (cytidine1402-2'-O)-methyltransferase|nr:16S rRNA (cytidine(1402)-2'-O)-methyltransferase [Gaiellales bacterium]
MSDTGALVVCPTPIGNLGDITLRALDELRRADAAACEDTRHSRTLLDRHGIHLPLIALHEHNERAQAPAIVRRVAAGERICLLTDAGFPAVSDPGAVLITAALGAGIQPVVLPGASAVPVALAASGMAGGGYVFAGFLPRAAGALTAVLDRLDAAALPIVAFESPRRLPATLSRIAARDPGRVVAVCRELTKLHEQVERGSAEELAARFHEPPKGEVTIVLAAVEPPPAALPDADLLAELAAAVGAKRAAALASALSGAPRNALYAMLTDRS